MRKIALTVVSGLALAAFATSTAMAQCPGHDVKSAETTVPAQTATTAPMTPVPTPPTNPEG
jgi:hypothetical protein